MQFRDHSDPASTVIGQQRAVLSDRGFSVNIQKAWLYWARAFLLANAGRSPRELGLADVERFVHDLQRQRELTAASREQALRAIDFLYTEVLEQPLVGLDDLLSRARRDTGPLLLSPAQVQDLLDCMSGSEWLMASLVYGAGLRLMECVRLRVRDIDERRILVRDGSGRFTRSTVIPARARTALRDHLEELKQRHIRELADGYGAVRKPTGVSVPGGPLKSWSWQFVFPGPYNALRAEAEAGCLRDHVPEVEARQAIEAAARQAGIRHPVSGSTLRNSFAAHLLKRGVPRRDVERLLGIVRTAKADAPESPTARPATAAGDASAARSA